MSAKRAYRSRRIKRSRRSKQEIADIRQAMYDIIAPDPPMTDRQVFYQLVHRGIVDKTEGQYKGTVVRLLGLMRRQGQLPFDWITDGTRWMRKPRTYSSMQSMLDASVELYRRELWNDQDVYVEIWLEKEALAGVLYRITSKWDVPLMVTRGYPSLSFLHSAAELFEYQFKPVYLYYLGDHDPSGVHIPRKIEADLREFAPDAEIHFKVVAVTPAQIKEFGLPTRPTKKSDSRSKNFEGDSVEVDAIPPDELRNIVNGCIVQHIDSHAMAATERIEQQEKETLEGFLESWDAA